MQALHDVAPKQAPPVDPPPPCGEVVILNGLQAGTRQPLTSPLMLIGRAAHCDIRVGGDDVKPLHCALVLGPTGPILRDLQMGGLTFVNDEPIATCHLRADDVISVGPFRFQVRWTPVSRTPETDAAAREKEALRIQAAAVVAQQSALTEEEIRLQQRRNALEQQERQLAALLDEKQQRLISLRDEARQAQASLRDDRAAFESRVAQVLGELTLSRQEVQENQRQNGIERKRLLILRQRLKRRWHKQWAAEREAMRRRALEVAHERQNLEAEKQRHDHQVARFTERRLRWNAEIELGRRHLRSDRALLRRRHNELHAAEKSLRQWESVLLEEEKTIVQAKEEWEALRREREQEIAGLENRIANLRTKHEQQQPELQRLQQVLATTRSPAPVEAVKTDSIPAPAPGAYDAERAHLQRREWQLGQDEATLQARMAQLERLTGDLADQHSCLVAELEGLAVARHRWTQAHAEAAVALESLAARLREQEDALESHRQALERTEQDLRERANAIDRQRKHVESRNAILLVQASAWEAEREQLLAELRGTEARQITCRERDLYEQQLRNFRDEIERLAGLLLDAADSPNVPKGQAA